MATEKNNFVEILKRDNEKIKVERAERIGQSVKEAHIRLLLDKKAKIRKYEDQLSAMTDLSASNNSMDVNAIKDIDAAEFANKYQELSEKIYVEKEKYKIAISVGTELYGIDINNLS